ncbi:hypothetical protein P4O66_020911 [Electrophorus voltai]|uniref:DUF6729 domain-containing protein n=1 Tax=Electrophorus voltai TaxID=2609070 RepID=A0AAD9E3X0_9TELE|nr:hypothetical protein P4O66_020911 [Electrophorus voltai]
MSCDKEVVCLMRGRTLGNSVTSLYRHLCVRHRQQWLAKSSEYLSMLKKFLTPGTDPSTITRQLPPMVPLPTPKWLLTVYARDVLSRLEETKARVVLKMDSTKKVTEKLASTAAWATNVGNEFGQVLVSVLAVAEGEGLLPMARQLPVPRVGPAGRQAGRVALGATVRGGCHHGRSPAVRPLRGPPPLLWMGSDPTRVCYSGQLEHYANQLSQQLLGLQLAEDYTSPGEYTGELIGVEYLYSQTGVVLQEDLGRDPDAPDGISNEDLSELENEGFVDMGFDEFADPASESSASRMTKETVPDGHVATQTRALSGDEEDESLGPDGVPSYHHIVNLDLRHQAFATQQRLEQSLKRCFLGQGSGPAQWPSVSRLVEAVCPALCRLHPAGQTVAGVRVNRWASVTRDYGVIRDVVLGSPGLVTRTRIQLFELNQRTLTQWYNARKKKQEQDVLHLSVGQSSTPMVAPEPLPPALSKLPERPTRGHPAFDFNIQQDASRQASRRV